MFIAKVNEYIDTKCFEDAYKKLEWTNAMKEEIDALQKNDIWKLVPRVIGQKVIGCKWVYKTKFNSDGTLNRCKARLVAKGYSQTYGIDYDKTFSPVAKMALIRIVMSLASSLIWTLHPMDVKNTFLNGFLKEEVFIEQSEGFKDSANPEFVCKLKRGLYGLKQSPRIWFERLANYLKVVSFKQSLAYASVFVMNAKNDIVIIVLYVDDLIMTSNNDDSICEIKKKLSPQFEMKDLGELKYFLCIEVVKCSNGLMFSQRKYMIDMLRQFGMQDCKSIQTPMETNVKLEVSDDNVIADIKIYQQMVGKLIYLTITRPDIAFSVGAVSKYMQKPKKVHLVAVKQIVIYIKGTTNYGILYTNNNFSPSFFCDADWVGDKETRRSTTGYCCSLESGVVSWLS